MTKKARISAESLPELRDFLASAEVDMGCRPVAVKRGDRYTTTVISERRGARSPLGAAIQQRPDRGSRGGRAAGNCACGWSGRETASLADKFRAGSA